MTDEIAQPDKYIHSVKVPNKFKTAAKFISNAIKQGISLKTQLYNSSNEVFCLFTIFLFLICHQLQLTLSYT